MPSERSFAIHNTQQFLFDMLDPKKTPRVPRAIREKCRRLLRHYPSSFWLDTAAKTAPDIFGPIDAKLDHIIEWEERRKKRED